MQDRGDLDALLGDGDFAVIEDLQEADEPWLEWDLVAVSAVHRGTHKQGTHANVEHQQPVKEGMSRPQGPDRGLGKLEPWYPQLGQPDEEDHVEDDPFQEQAHRRDIVLD